MATATGGTLPEYAGLVTRVIAFSLDAAIVNLVAIIVGLVVGVALSVLHVPSEAKQLMIAAGAGAYLLWTAGYFIVFWSTTGQTPGDRVMRIRVLPANPGRPIKPRRALVRLIGMTIAAIPLFAGYFLILVDSRRRGLHDRFARTLVVHVPDLQVPEPRPRRTSP